MMRLLVALAVVTLGGCSIWNAPDPNLRDVGPSFDAGDAGIDVPLDVGGDDAPDGGVIFDREMNCSDTFDDDMDGVADCDDPDCASRVECCTPAGGRTSLVDQANWCPLPGDWTFSGLRAVSCALASDTPGPNYAVFNTCLPLASGATITASINWSGACETCEAMLALSPIETGDPGSGLLEDLAIRVREADGRVVLDLTRAGRLLARLPSAGSLPAGTTRVTLNLFPAVSDDGEPTLRAELEAVDALAGRHRVEALDVLSFPSDLTGVGGGCDVSPGLYLGLQARGTTGSFGAVSVLRSECANPNFFRPAALASGLPGDALWLEAPDLGYGTTAPEQWTVGGIGGASVALYRSGSTDYWRYFIDGTNLNRANDQDQDLDFSIGATTADRLGLSDFDTAAGGAPLAGHARPTCISGPDCGMLDYREPAVLIPRSPSGTWTAFGAVFWVSRQDEGPSQLLRATIEPGTPDVMGAATVVSVPSGCDVAHPVVASLSEDEHLLFYTCGQTVMGVSLTPTFSPMGDPVSLLTASDLGFALGLVDFDVVANVRGTIATLQLWMAGRDARGLTRVALASGFVDLDRSESPFPELRPFSGNPVLSVDDPILADGCEGVCRITAIGVARELTRRTIVRVVLSVTDESKTMVPLEQTLP